MIAAGYQRMNLEGDSLVLFGPAAASSPRHARRSPAPREGDGILIDGGTTIEGYAFRYHAHQRPRQAIRQAAARLRHRPQGAGRRASCRSSREKCGSVDDAARAVITKAGFGPNYKYFAHRLGHGIGMDEHEQPYLVRGNRVILEPSMTFSNEPGIYVPGEYGLRCEDDMAISESGAATLLTPGFAPTLATPIA